MRSATKRAFRVFTLEDLFCREALALTIDHSLPALRVIRELEVVTRRTDIRRICASTTARSSSAGRSMRGLMPMAFSSSSLNPGKPTQNGHVESFNGKVRDEFLNEHWFASIAEAQVLGEAFRVDFNTVRPHSSLNYLTPMEFLQSIKDNEPPGGRRNDERELGQGVASPLIVSTGAGSPAVPAHPEDHERELRGRGVTY